MRLMIALCIAIFWTCHSLCAPSGPLQPKQLWQSPSPRAAYTNSSTASMASTVPYGIVIQDCTVPGTVALTFDDGPYIYTGQVLDELAANGVKATFMVNGQNWANIYSNANLVQRMIAEGHQVGSHTWDHTDLTTLDYDGIVSEMSQLATALQSIIGVSPTYMRPPYFATNAFVLSTLGSLGYHVIDASIDTKDYLNDAQDLIQNAVNTFDAGIDAGGSIELSHDVHQWTANVLVQAMIDKVRSKGLMPVTVGECLGDPAPNWYM